jgi:hypothetical protein
MKGAPTYGRARRPKRRRCACKERLRGSRARPGRSRVQAQAPQDQAQTGPGKEGQHPRSGWPGGHRPCARHLLCLTLDTGQALEATFCPPGRRSFGRPWPPPVLPIGTPPGTDSIFVAPQPLSGGPGPERGALPGPKRACWESVDQWISGGRCSHGGAETRRKQREETATGHKGNWCVPCSCLCVKRPWFPTGVLHYPGGHPPCAGA